MVRTEFILPDGGLRRKHFLHFRVIFLFPFSHSPSEPHTVAVPDLRRPLLGILLDGVLPLNLDLIAVPVRQRMSERGVAADGAALLVKELPGRSVNVEVAPGLGMSIALDRALVQIAGVTAASGSKWRQF